LEEIFMKRLHQLLAGLLAVATVCAVSLVPAFADTYAFSDSDRGYIGDGKTSDITGIPVTSTFSLERAGLMPEGNFTYTLTPATVEEGTKSGRYDVYSGVAVGTGTDGSSSVTIKFNSTGYNKDAASFSQTQTATIPISIPADTPNGIYRYTLSQANIGVANASAEYTTKTYTVDLNVISGKVVLVQVAEANGDKANPEFTNLIKNNDSLIIKDYVYSSYGPLKDFTFSLTVPEGGNENGVQLTKGTTIYGYKHKSDGTLETVTITVTEDGKLGTGGTYTLGHEEWIEFPGLPVNLKYFTNEDDAATDGYTSIYHGYSTQAEFLSNAVSRSEYTASTTKTFQEYNLSNIHYIEYVNTRDISATGVTMDTTPYIVMFVAAAGLAVLSLAKKKIVR
jgi:hypothetical protein